MARRTEFKAIANDLISSFVSRNNDVYGYWGIGKLYSHMVSTSSRQLKIDLLRRTIEPRNEAFQLLIDQFAGWLSGQLRNRRIKQNFLIAADLTIVRYPNDPSPYVGQSAANRVVCTLVLWDNLDREHLSVASTWCREHDPKREFKSTRKY